MASRIESAPAAERYFCTLSPLCKRIISNVHTIRTIHADWQDLSYADQCDVIDGHMVNQETAEHWRRLSRQPGDGAPSVATIPAGPKMVEDEDPETGQVVRWRDEHAAPFSWRTPSQERLAADSLSAAEPADSPVRQQPFMMRDSIRQRLSRVEHMYESYSPKRTVGDGFDSPSVVLGGSSGGESDAPGGRSLKQQVMSRLAHGRRVLLSITKLGKQPAEPRPLRRLEISSPCSAVEPVRARSELSSPQPSRGAASPVGSVGSGVSRSASFRRPTKPCTPPPPPPVQAAVVPIRTSAAHAPSVRSSSQYAAPAAPPSPPPPTAGARAQPTPPQLKRVAPPVVPPRRDSLTPEREPPGARPPGDGSELAPQVDETRASPPRLFTQQKYEPEPESDSEPEPEPEWKLRQPEPEPEWQLRQPDPEPEWKHRQPEPEPEPQEAPEPEPFTSVLQEPTKVDIKTGFDFLDNW
ncbi:vegetative cell wall protein gp1-like [Amphibalanus amphitrite]|uniref:vegetative cell wall protein gp1-like n=1 Tax=Amphibalanus amphitrite TaxID=1232801 RepID=UPI001C905B80|nr:vegetative cell wall protein gp1-like [Amphibalanus amphitrite]XP_043228845.1 vegetative cell wall protein gp1-like [Amphibalanus amphitrite]XP_043228846.1 vegetative cell wall protein gp1-like [Amphibalanus amphitrite]